MEDNIYPLCDAILNTLKKYPSLSFGGIIYRLPPAMINGVTTGAVAEAIEYLIDKDLIMTTEQATSYASPYFSLSHKKTNVVAIVEDD